MVACLSWRRSSRHGTGPCLEDRRELRKRFPAATEIAYDNYDFFVIGYSPTERPLDSVVSLVAGANGVSMCFIYGARLPDPHGLLLGSGKQTRFIRLESAAVLRKPDVRTLMALAVAQAKAPMPARGRGEAHHQVRVCKAATAQEEQRFTGETIITLTHYVGGSCRTG